MTPPIPCLDPTELCYEPDCVKAPRNLDLWLPFDETSGTTAQNVLSMFGAPNGTQVNGPTPVPGKVAGALSFDGSNDHVVVPTHPAVDVTTGDFTIDAWIRVPAAGWTGVATIVDKRNLVGGATTGYSLFLFKNSSGAIQLGLQLADGTFANYLSGPLPIVAGQWHFVAVSVRRGGSSVFVLDATSYPFSHAHPLSLSNSSAVYVGQSSPALGGGSHFRGDIDELEIFRRALGLGELHTLWRASYKGKCKEGCSLPPRVKLCHDQNSVAATGWVANGTTVPRTYTCWFQGLPAGSGGTVGGPTVFTVNPTVVVSVPPMTRKSFSVTIAKPLDMTKLGQVGGFLMMVESSSGDTFTCHSAVVDVWNYLCPHSWDPNQGGITLRVGTPNPLDPIRLTNSTNSVVSFPYRLVPVNDDRLEDTSVVSLNGLPPGSYPTGTAVIPPLGTVDIDITAEFVEYDGLGTYTVQFEADMDGDTLPDFLCGQVLNSYVGNGGPAVYIGVAAPTTVGTPRLAINRYPTIGDAGFQILANGLVPNGISALALAPALANPPLSLVLFGGQPNSILYCDPGSMQTVPLASGSSGTVALPVPLPNNPALIGATSYWQVFDVDVGLPYALPLGNSNAMSITIR